MSETLTLEEIKARLTCPNCQHWKPKEEGEEHYTYDIDERRTTIHVAGCTLGQKPVQERRQGERRKPEDVMP